MANFPTDVLEDIARGKDYYSGLNAEHISNLEDGCSNCTVKNYKCLKRLLRSLDYKVELDEYDDIAKELVKDMLIIIGDYTIKIPPSVDAGENDSAPIDEVVNFHAAITLGSGSLVSVLWTIISGSGTLINANTADVSISGFPVGNTVLKVVVTDSNDLKASDTVTLTGEAVVETVKVYYLSKSTNVLPTESEILAADFIEILPGAVNYDVPVNDGGFNYHFVAQNVTEPNKIRWQDTVDADNNGLMGVGNTWYAAGTVTTFEVYGNSFKTEFDNPIRFIS